MKTENLTQLRSVLADVSTAVLITRARNDLLRARAMVLAGVEESGRIWLSVADGDGSFDKMEGETRVHLVFQQGESLRLSVNGIATLAAGRQASARFLKASLPGWLRDRGGDSENALISVDPRNVVWWSGDAWNTVAQMFRVAKVYVEGQSLPTAELKEHRLLAA